jgi:hypothetical protein
MLPPASLSAVPEYAVFVRSQAGSVHHVGPHTFPEPINEGDRVTFQGESWVVVEIRPAETRPVMVLEFPARNPPS